MCFSVRGVDGVGRVGTKIYHGPTALSGSPNPLPGTEAFPLYPKRNFFLFYFANSPDFIKLILIKALIQQFAVYSSIEM